MKKIYLYITIIIIAFFVFQYGILGKINLSSKYKVIQHQNKNNVIQTIANYIFIPIIDSRIDFYLKNTGIISHLQNHKYDNRQIKIEDIKEGEGQTVICGQNVLIDLEEIIHNKITQSMKNKKITIGIDKIQALNIGLIGMKKGGSRNILIPNNISERLSGIKDKNILYKITLKELKSYHSDSTDNLLIFDQVIGNEKAIMCGEYVSLKYKTRNAKGDFMNENILNFKVGEGKVPLAFELGVIEMTPGSKRSIISPPDLLGKESSSIDQVTILDLTIN